MAEPSGAAKAAPATAHAAALVHDPGAYRRSFSRRAENELPFDPAVLPPDLPVMFDTTFYIHRLQGQVPPDTLTWIGTRRVLHSAIALAELSITAGILDPGHPDSGRNTGPLLRLLEAIRLSDSRAPSPVAWVEAGMLSGILARTQFNLVRPKKQLTPAEECCQKGRRRELLNDALVFLTAREQGAILISANASDMDVLLRFRPDTRILLYRQTQRAK